MNQDLNLLGGPWCPQAHGWNERKHVPPRCLLEIERWHGEASLLNGPRVWWSKWHREEGTYLGQGPKVGHGDKTSKHSFSCWWVLSTDRKHRSDPISEGLCWTQVKPYICSPPSTWATSENGRPWTGFAVNPEKGQRREARTSDRR